MTDTVATFEATAVQERLIETALDGDHRIIGFGGGIRGTKTWGSLAFLILMCRMFPASRWAVVRKDLQRVRDTVIPSFEKLRRLTGDFMGPVQQSSENESWLSRADNGSVILFRGENIDKDPTLERFHGYEVNGFVAEEADELSERTFIKMIERAGAWLVPDGGDQPPPYIICTFNPCPGWPKRRFFVPWRAGTIQAPYAFIPTTAADNPYISPAQREAWKEMPEAEYKRFVLGDWESLTGAYYDALDLTPGTGHLIEPFDPPKHWRFWSSYDWGYGHWACFLFWCTDEQGVDYLIDSVWVRRMQDTEQADAINDEARRLNVPGCLKLAYAGHDCWSSVTARGATGETTAEIFAKQGILLVKADIDKVNGGRAVNRQLAQHRVKIMRTKGNLKGVDQLGEIMPDEDDIRKPGKVDADPETGEGGDDWADAFRYGLATRIAKAAHPTAEQGKRPDQALPLKVKDGKLVPHEREPRTLDELVKWAEQRKTGNGRVPVRSHTPIRR